MGWGRNAGKEPSSLADWDLGLEPTLLRSGRRGWHSGAHLQTVPWGDKNMKQGATALPWQVLDRLSHA